MAYAEKSELIEKAVVAPHAFWLMQVCYLLNGDIHVNPERENSTALGTNTLPPDRLPPSCMPAKIVQPLGTTTRISKDLKRVA